MKVSLQLRAILYRNRQFSMTVRELSERTGESQTAVSCALRRMPDTYIHDWPMNDYGRHVAGWRIVIPPQDAPKPCKKN